MRTATLIGVLGVLTGFFLCWSFLVRPLQANLAAREEALQDWERINRMERNEIANIKSIGGEELRKWVATLEEQNNRYMELQSVLHKQEVALAGPATTHLAIALFTVIGTIGFVAWMIRDSNAQAAITLGNVVAVLPSLREALATRQEDSPVLQVEQTTAIREALTSESTTHSSRGTIVKYLDDKGFGFIRPDEGGEDVFFHRDQMLDVSLTSLKIGSRVSYEAGVDTRGRPCAKRVVMVADIGRG